MSDTTPDEPREAVEQLFASWPAYARDDRSDYGRGVAQARDAVRAVLAGPQANDDSPYIEVTPLGGSPVDVSSIAFPRLNLAVVWSDEDHQFAATCEQFPSLSWLDPTPTGAMVGLLERLSEILGDA